MALTAIIHNSRWHLTFLMTLTYCCVHCGFGHDSTPVTINTCGGCGGSSGGGSIDNQLAFLQDLIMQAQKTLEASLTQMNPEVIRDCTDVYKAGNHTDGTYYIHPENCNRFQVKCIFDTDGLWTIIQNRVDGSTDFQRSWLEYLRGFGSLQGNFWLGLRRIFSITNQRQYTLRVDLEDWEGAKRYAEYRNFRLGPEQGRFTLYYSNYSGTAGDAFGVYHKGMRFSTFDEDNDIKADEQCALVHGGGWWYRDCDHGNLNGYYNYEPKLTGPTDQGVEWDAWKTLYSFKTTQMRIKPTFSDLL